MIHIRSHFVAVCSYDPSVPRRPKPSEKKRVLKLICRFSYKYVFPLICGSILHIADLIVAVESTCWQL